MLVPLPLVFFSWRAAHPSIALLGLEFAGCTPKL